MLAAVPGWLEDNVALASLLVLLIVAIAVIRLVRKSATRIVLMVVIILAAGFVLAERGEFETCGSSCECDPGSVRVTVPFCDP